MKTNMYTHIKTFLILFALIVQWHEGKSVTNGSNLSFSINCPPNVYVSCKDEIWNLSMYGNATYSIGYHTYSAGSPVVKYYLNSCNAGYITRTWTVEDPYWQWQSCTQTIYVSSGGQGGPVIEWPEDINLTGCNPETNPYKLPAPNNYPRWNDSECSMLGKSYSDMLFTVNSQCKKIMRTWKILDWCNYSPSAGYGIYTKVQFIYIINSTPPAITCPAEITVNATNCKNGVLVAQSLYVDPSVCGGDFVITNNSPYATSKGNNISGTYPIGTTKVTYSVKYGCNDFKTCTTNVVVKNASKPTPYCTWQLSTALMGIDTDNDGKVDDGMVEIWAKDLDKGSFSSCGYGPLKYSFGKDVTKTSKVFTCENIGKNLVEMWVTDTKGAQNYCLVELYIQNNGANIPDCHSTPVTPVDPVYSQKGNVLTLTDTPVKGADITLKYKDPVITYTSTFDTTETLQLDSFINLSGYKLYRYVLVKKITEHRDSTLTFITRKVKTDANGKYLIDSIAVHNKAVTISATYTDDVRKNIDNKDVELLTKFLLGEVTFSSYHQYLASDINEDGKIDVEDQNILMSFVTGQIQTLPGSHQWYLLDKKATFAKPEDVLTGPLPFNVNLDSIKLINPAVDFIAIKKGNISIDPNSLLNANVENRTTVLSQDIVKAYPNPFIDQITFSLNTSHEGQARLYLYNSNGQEIRNMSFAVAKGDNEINVGLNDDIYGLVMYRWTIGDKQYSGILSKIK